MPCRRWNSRSATRVPGGVRGDPGDRVRVVRREHRIDGVSGVEERPGAGEVRDVGVRLPREHRIAREAEHLRALDLGVPVRALDQPDRDARARCAGERDEPVDDRARTLLVGLDREAQPHPAGQRRIAAQPGEDLERQLEAIGFLRVDGEPDADALRQHSERRHRRDELVENAARLRELVARVQRRELDRDRGLHPRRRSAVGDRCADRRDRIGIGVRVASRVRGRVRRLAQHVERVARIRMRRLACAARVPRRSCGPSRTRRPSASSRGAARRGRPARPGARRDARSPPPGRARRPRPSASACRSASAPTSTR